MIIRKQVIMMKTLLLTGFEPFLKFTVNPTMKIVEELHGKVIGNYKIHSEVLTVDFQSSGKQLLTHIEELKPDAVISLGLAGGRYKMTPERIAINVKDGEPDNNGNTPVDEQIQAQGEAGYMSTLPVRAMVERLIEEGLPAEVSNTAGTYLCNNVMYEGLHYAATQRPTMKSGFLHIPASHELAIEHGKIPSWSHEYLKKGVAVCIEVLSSDES
jgi:pyroglutamyl-peptidase